MQCLLLAMCVSCLWLGNCRFEKEVSPFRKWNGIGPLSCNIMFLSCDLFKTSQKNEISFSKPYLERESMTTCRKIWGPWKRVQTRNGSVEGGMGLIVTTQLVSRTVPLVTTDKFSLAARLKASKISFYLPCSVTVFHIASSLVFGLSRNIPTFHLCKLLAKTFSLAKIIWIILLFFIAILDKIPFAFVFLIYNVYPSKLILIFSCDLIK